MKLKVLLMILIAIAGICGGFLISESIKPDRSDREYTRAYLQNNRIYSIVLPENLDFAGEPVPLHLYYVREGLDRELLVNTYWQSNTLLLLKKANRYFRVIEPILKKNNLPDDFKYLALIESGLSNVVSPAGASGFWQFMKETGKRYGLEITEEVDERYHLERSTEAACKLLKHSYDLLGSWALAAAAYNAGEGGISRTVGKQKTNSYYDLYLNQETSRYLYRILALKLLYEHPTEFGYYLRNKDLYPPIPYHQVSIDSTVNDLNAFALKSGINYRILKEFNPWLRMDKLTVKPGKKYVLNIPSRGYDNYQSLMQEIREPDRIFNDTLTTGRLFK